MSKIYHKLLLAFEAKFDYSGDRYPTNEQMSIANAARMELGLPVSHSSVMTSANGRKTSAPIITDEDAALVKEMSATSSKKYEIIKAIGLSKLEAAINECLAKGATLVGGPFCVPSDERRDVWYAQGVLHA